MTRKHILLISLGAYGDCLMATTIARQIKIDYPGCHLTWAVSYKFSSVIDNNPDVDCIWSVSSLPGESLVDEVWRRVKDEASKRQAAGELDLVFDVQIYPDNVLHYDGTTRSSTFRCYPNPITIPVAPVIWLRDSEQEKVQNFVRQYGFAAYRHVVLFECAPSSGQSVLNQKMGVAIAEQVVANHADAIVIVSTHLPFVPPHPRIVDGSCLSFRENAALSHYCTLLVGCSSGITWLLTSEAAKKLPTVQFLNRQAMASGFASVAYDFAHWGLPTDHIIENDSSDVSPMSAIVNRALEDFSGARTHYHQAFKPAFWDCLCFVDYRSLRGMSRFYRTVGYFHDRNSFVWRDYLNIRPLWRVVYHVWQKVTSVIARQVLPLNWRLFS